MRRVVLLALLVAGCGAEEAARAPVPAPVVPDGVLVLGVLGPERAMVADPVTGRTVERELRGGTLCAGPVRVVGDRVAWWSGRGLVAVPLTLAGRPRATREPRVRDGMRVLSRWRRAGKPMPGTWRHGPTALSADATRLAAVLSARGGFRLGVLDRTHGTWQVVRGARPAGYAAVAWSPSGEWLYFTAARQRLVAWHAREGTRRLPIRPGGRVLSLATGTRSPATAPPASTAH